MSLKKLIVNADDYGMNEGVSRGILAASAAGSVRSTTAMTNCPDFERAMDDVKSAGCDIDVGMHLNLTWGRPLSNPDKIPTLVDDAGVFLRRGALLRKSLLGEISEDEIYRELRLQCERLLGRLGSITHLDGHHHVHIFPVVRGAVSRLAKELSIPFVRAPLEGSWSPLRWQPLRRLGISLISSSGARYWRSRGFNTSDHFGGFALGAGEGFKDRWLRTMDLMPEGVCEIMVHPGYSSPENDSYDSGRQAELDWLADDGLLEAARRRGIVFTSFAEFC